jgi:hypothetical protein
MAFNPGRNVGRVSIRTVPDTTGFRRDLIADLRRIQKTTRMVIDVVAKVDRSALRRSIEQQSKDINLPKFDVDGEVSVDKANVQRQRLREQIQRQLDAFGDFKANLAAQVKDKERFEREIKRLVDRAERNEVDIPVTVSTAIANSRLAYASRTRVVDFIVRVNKASLTAAATTLAALSGARLSYEWVDSIATFARDLDKNLPSILSWTTGITSLAAGLFAATSGVVGFGQGLVAITPGLLLIPGLIANATGSIIALFVALKNSKKELAPLADSMNELGQIINTTFWDRARQPIIDLVTNLMPQLRDSFRDISEGIGDFTAELSRAFGEEFANGRLESIFRGIADGWRVLASGADGFAGAMVSLSQIAANYTPRLAHWLVRQANTLDAWLERTANNGRMDELMQGAIDSVYALWDATTGLAGVFSGLWKAADSAGSAGLRGFADMMQEWKRVVQGVDFQRGLTAIFRGSYVAMDAFGRAVESIGRLFSDRSFSIETFIGSAGTFAGGLVEAIGDALNSADFAVGLLEFSDGLERALSEIKPSLQPIADTFSGFLGLLGDMAATLLPTATGVLAELMPSIDNIIGAVRDVLPELGDAAQEIAETLGPAAADIVSALTPGLVSALEGFADTAVPLADALASFASAAGPIADAYSMYADAMTSLTSGGAKALIDLSWLWDDKAMDKLADQIIGDGGWFGDALKWAQEFDAGFVDVITNINRLADLDANTREFMTSMSQSIVDTFANIADWLLNPIQRTLELVAGAMIGFQTGNWDPFWSALANSGASGAEGAATASMEGMTHGFGMSRGAVTEAMNGLLTESVFGPMQAAVSTLFTIGGSAITSFVQGAQSVWAAISGWFSTLGAQVAGAVGDLGSTLWNAGSAIMRGFRRGLEAAYEGVKTFVSGIAGWIAANKGPESYDRKLLEPAGGWIMSGFQRGLERGFTQVQSRVETFADDIRDQFGPALGTDIQSSLVSGLRAANSAIAAHEVGLSADATVGSSATGEHLARRGNVSLTINNPVVRDTLLDAQEAADILNAVG